MRRVRWMALSVVVLLVVAGSAYAKQGPRMHKKAWQRVRERMEKMEKNLFTEEQKQQLAKLRQHYRELQRKVRKEIAEARRELSKAISSGDRQACDKIIDKVVSLQRKLLRYRVEFAFKVREILTPEQFQKWQEMKKNLWVKKRGHRRGMRNEVVGYGSEEEVYDEEQ